MLADPTLLKLTEARIASYQACYYRLRYLRWRRPGDPGLLYPREYPASRAVGLLRALA